MWTRLELKMRAKEAFRRNYWPCVIVAFVMALINGLLSNSASNSNSETNTTEMGEHGIAMFLAIYSIVAIIAIIALVAKIIIGNVLLVGGNRFFVINQTEDAKVGTLLYGFKTGSVGNIVLVMFLRDLFTALWTLLLIIPGIIKHYEYLMVPYILAENPDMSQRQAFAISKRMMRGQKMDVFILDMSFLGWKILEGLTLGIAGIFYVEPYYQATMAELYTANRTSAYQSGYIR